jgi:hypothetical protein
MVALSERVDPTSFPLHGLRLSRNDVMSGWWIWVGDGDNLPDDFRPEHAAHLTERCPAAVGFTALPLGWRFVVTEKGDGAAEFDQSLLDE